MDYGLIGIRMDRRKKKELTRLGNGMAKVLLIGVRLEKRGKKELTRMGRKMDFGFIDMKMVGRKKKDFLMNRRKLYVVLNRRKNRVKKMTLYWTERKLKN